MKSLLETLIGVDPALGRRIERQKNRAIRDQFYRFPFCSGKKECERRLSNTERHGAPG